MMLSERDHAITVQREMIRDMNLLPPSHFSHGGGQLGWQHPCQRTCRTGQRIACTLGELFDLYALHLWIAEEKGTL